MLLPIDSFTPKHDWLVCVDSDGTVIDAMNVKHALCHGKSFIEEWELDAHAQAVQSEWDSINLYERSRGVNRFIALLEMLRRMDGRYLRLEPGELDALADWVAQNDLSNKSLTARIALAPSPLLEKALHWSLALNERIAALLPADKPPFAGAAEALALAGERADVAVVSSSNMSAILEEWTAHGLADSAGVMTSQETGTKGACIARLLAKGYAPDHTLMIGDAYPDVDASRENGVYYYPIRTRHEAESWAEFRNHYLDAFLSGAFGLYQQRLLDAFENNFAKKGE